MRSLTRRALAVEQVGGDDLVVVVRGVGEGAAAVDVAERPDAGDVGAQLVVDGDVAARVGRDAGARRGRGRRCSAGGRRRRAGGCPRSAAPCRRRSNATRTPLPPCAPPTRRASRTTKWKRSPSRSRIACTSCETSRSSRAIRRSPYSSTVTLRAEAPVHLRELEADVAAADDDQVLGQRRRAPSSRCWSGPARRRCPASRQHRRGRRR